MSEAAAATMSFPMAIVPWYCQHVLRQADERGARENKKEHTYLE